MAQFDKSCTISYQYIIVIALARIVFQIFEAEEYHDIEI